MSSPQQVQAGEYDPFARGPFAVGVRTIEALDKQRNRRFPIEFWYPAVSAYAGQDVAPQSQDSFTVPFVGVARHQSAVRDAVSRARSCPFVAYSHPSGVHRRSATFLCTHLASYGYLVAGLDHSEVVVPELGRRPGETEGQKRIRWRAVIEARVPDLRFLLDEVLGGALDTWGLRPDADRVAVVGHSLGGSTALAAPDVEPRICCIVALAPGGASRPKPGILPVTLDFRWGREVPTLILAAENDVSLPLDGVEEVFRRTPEPKRMVVLRRADHMHFMDGVEELHEAVRNMPMSGELSWLAKEMRPVAELCTGEQAHVFTRGLTLAHLDATLRERPEADLVLAGDVETVLAERGVDAIAYQL